MIRGLLFVVVVVFCFLSFLLPFTFILSHVIRLVFVFSFFCLFWYVSAFFPTAIPLLLLPPPPSRPPPNGLRTKLSSPETVTHLFHMGIHKMPQLKQAVVIRRHWENSANDVIQLPHSKERVKNVCLKRASVFSLDKKSTLI